MSNMLRKTIFALVPIVILCAFNPSYASSTDVKRFIEGTSNQVIQVIKTASSESQKKSTLTKIFIDCMDVDWIAKFVMGQHWSTLSETQKISYMKAYRKFLVAKYVMLFRDYNGQQVRIDDVQDLGNNTYVIATYISNENDKGTEYKVQYRIKQDGEHFKIRDIIAENISMLSTQRSDFSSIISSSGFNALIDKLNSKSTSSDKE